MADAPAFVADRWAVKAQEIAKRLAYPLPEGWRDDPDQVASLRELFPKVLERNENIIANELRLATQELSVSAEQLEQVPAIADVLHSVDSDVISGRHLIRAVLNHLRSEAANG